MPDRLASTVNPKPAPSGEQEMTTPSREIQIAELEAIADAALELIQGISWTMLQGKVVTAKLAPESADALPRLAAALDGWRPKKPAEAIQ